MTRSTRSLTAAIAVLPVFASTLAAEETSVQQLQSQVQELQRKLDAVEARQASNSKDVAATIDSVLRDAEKRSQLLQNNGEMGAGYDNGYYIRSGDAWSFRPGVQFQFRNVTNYRDNADGDDEDIQNGFEVRRLKFSFEGTAFTKDLEYAFVWATSRTSGSPILEDAFVKYMFADDWGFRAGQYKDPVHHEELTSSKRQLAVDRSLVNELLGGGVTDRVQGVSLIYGGYNKNNPLNAELAFHDGINSDNTNFTKGDEGADFGVGGRVEFKAAGDWKAYRDFSAMGTKEDLLVIGAGGDWTQFGDGDNLLGTLDLQWENSAGLGVYLAGLVAHRDEQLVGGTDDSTDWGLLAQVGYLINPAWEPFARASYTEFDEAVAFDNGDSEDSFLELTVGLNYYLGNNGSAGHRAKVTLDLTYLPDGSAGGDSGIGFIGDNNAEDEWVVRGQFQLLI